MIRRWLPRAVAGVVIGLILNISVAWLTAMALPIGPSLTLPPTPERGFVGSIPPSFGEPTRAFVSRKTTSEYWQVQWDGPDDDEYFKDETVAYVFRHGFPFRTLEVRKVYVGPASPIEYSGPIKLGGIQMPRWHTKLWVVRTTNTPYTDQLPWLPIWPGLLANTLIYGMIVLSMWLGLGRLRRRRRVRRGLCAECAYELAGLATCPECGVCAYRPSSQPA